MVNLIDHPLAILLAEVAAGKRAPADGLIEVLAPLDERSSGVFAFTGEVVVVADVDREWVDRRVPAGDLSEPLNPTFLTALTAATGLRVNCLDAVLVADPLPGPPVVALSPAGDLEHARVARAHRYRTDIRAWTCDGGVVVLGRGVAGRWEVAVEVDPPARGNGLGSALFTAARQLVAELAGPGEPLWAQVAPGNAVSVRALLAAGYRPAGAEALLVTHAGEPPLS